MALKATALASKKPRNVGRIFTLGLPRLVSNKANPMRNQPQPFAISGGARVQSAHEKTKQGLCSDPFCKPLRPVASTMCHGSACDDVVARAATSRIRLDADT
jgi:hypothetical protein